MSELQTFLKDKSYDFVPLLKKCDQREITAHNVLQKELYNGKLVLKITVVSPLHIGSGYKTCDNRGNILNLLMRQNDHIIIPGSSVKGMVRGIIEAVSYSCAVKLPDTSVSKLKEALPEKNRKHCKDKNERTIQKLCPACSIFGCASDTHIGYKGKVIFGDFICYEENVKIKTEILPTLQTPFKNYPKSPDIFQKLGSSNYGNERLYYCKVCDSGDCGTCSKQDYFKRINETGLKRKIEFRGRKFYHTNQEINKEDAREVYFEMLPKGSKLRGEILFQNLTEDEMKLLAYALDLRHDFRMKLGYGKPLGYGQIEMELEHVEKMGRRYSKDGKLTPEDILKLAEEYRKHNSEDDIKKAMEKLEQIMND